ncbi:hypothetical protein WCU61_19095 [Pectobacterium versatile]|uniref:hypothetical protein n=1 Tax=Pectobacterium versatile TaxID=2488639 RepID=UPI00301908EE
MKIINTKLLALSFLFTTTSYADLGDFDLQCKLSDDTTMTLSHFDKTVYLNLKSPNQGDEDEGEIIRLDIPSGEAQVITGVQPITNDKFFTLRGESKDFEEVIAVIYTETKKGNVASYSVMNGMGAETNHFDCIPDTIKTNTDLVNNGLKDIPKRRIESTPTSEIPVEKTVPLSSQSFSVNAKKTYIINNVNLPAWKLVITSKENDVIITGLKYNRGNCLISLPNRGVNMKQPLKFGQIFSFTSPSNDDFNKCTPLELNIETNRGSITYSW